MIQEAECSPYNTILKVFTKLERKIHQNNQADSLIKVFEQCKLQVMSLVKQHVNDVEVNFENKLAELRVTIEGLRASN